MLTVLLPAASGILTALSMAAHVTVPSRNRHCLILRLLVGYDFLAFASSTAQLLSVQLKISG